MRDESVDLRRLFKLLKKRIVFIASAVLIAATLAWVTSYFFLTPIYQSSIQILVNKENVDQQIINPQEIETNLRLINTYSVIIRSPAVLSIVIEDLGLDMKSAELARKLAINSAEESQVINISIEDSSSQRSVEILNTIGTVFQKEIQQWMKVDNVIILSKAELPENPIPIKPRTELIIVMGAVLGLVIGVGVTIIKDYFDTTIKSEKDLEELLELPILGLIRPINEEDLPTPNIQANQKEVTEFAQKEQETTPDSGT